MWTDKINKVNNQDCLELMKEMQDKCVDLTVTSPPYDNLRDYEGYTFNFEETAKELFRVTKDGGVVVWVVNDATINGSETGTSFKQALFFKETGFNLHDTMIYEKTGCPFPEVNRYYPIFEFMFVLSKGKPKSVNLIKDRKNNWAGSKVARRTHARQKDGSLKENSAFKNNPGKKLEEIGVRYNIWRISNAHGVGHTDKIENQHPATFPDKLVLEHIKSWSNENDLIFDPFMGSWTTAVAAQQLHRNFIGAELSSEYCKIGYERLRQQVLL